MHDAFLAAAAPRPSQLTWVASRQTSRLRRAVAGERALSDGCAYQSEPPGGCDRSGRRGAGFPLQGSVLNFVSWSPSGMHVAFTVRSDGEAASPPRAPLTLWVADVVRPAGVDIYSAGGH